MNLGNAIKQCRKTRKFTLAKLSDLTDISVSHLCLMEKNKRDPSLSAVKSIAAALCIPLSVLMFLAARSDEVKELDEDQMDQLTQNIMDLMNNATQQRTLF